MGVLIVVGIMLVLFIPQVWLHEQAHIRMGKLQGLSLVEARYWPTKVDGKWKMGYVRFAPVPVDMIRDDQRARIARAPIESNTIMIIAILVGVWLVPGWSPIAGWVPHLMLAFVLTNAIDGTYNCGRLAFWAEREDLTDNNDALKYVRYERVGLPWGRIIAAAWIAVVWLAIVTTVIVKWFPDIGFELE